MTYLKWWQQPHLPSTPFKRPSSSIPQGEQKNYNQMSWGCIATYFHTQHAFIVLLCLTEPFILITSLTLEKCIYNEKYRTLSSYCNGPQRCSCSMTSSSEQMSRSHPLIQTDTYMIQHLVALSLSLEVTNEQEENSLVPLFSCFPEKVGKKDLLCGSPIWRRAPHVSKELVVYTIIRIGPLP